MTDPAAARREELLEALLRETTIEYEGGAAWHEGGDPARALLAAFEADILNWAANACRRLASTLVGEPWESSVIQREQDAIKSVERFLRTRAAALRKGAE